MGERRMANARAIRQPRDRLTGQPPERQHSARGARYSEGDAGTRNRLPPARGIE